MRPSPWASPRGIGYGDDLPDLGELWTTPATWQLSACSAESIELVLAVLTPIAPARCSYGAAC